MLSEPSLLDDAAMAQSNKTNSTKRQMSFPPRTTSTLAWHLHSVFLTPVRCQISLVSLLQGPSSACSTSFPPPVFEFSRAPACTVGAPLSLAWTLSPPHLAWCCCTRLCFCWPRMMWQCHVSSSECRCYRLNGFSLLKRFPLSADGACGKALDQPVGEWLEHVGLPQYENKFLLNGFDDLRFMVSHLQHVIYVGRFHFASGRPWVGPASLSVCVTVLSSLTLVSKKLWPSSSTTPSPTPPFNASPFPSTTPPHLSAWHKSTNISTPPMNAFREYGLLPTARQMTTKSNYFFFNPP